MSKYLIIDTETSGLFDFKQPADAPGQPRMASITLIFLDEKLEVVRTVTHFIAPDGWEMSPEVIAVNGLTNEFLKEKGVPVRTALDEYAAAIDAGMIVVAHNAQFDTKVCRAELRRAGMDDRFERTPNICTMRTCTDILKIKGPRGNKFPKLSEAAKHFGIEQAAAHTSSDDAHVCAHILRRLVADGMCPDPQVYFAKEKPQPIASA